MEVEKQSNRGRIAIRFFPRFVTFSKQVVIRFGLYVCDQSSSSSLSSLSYLFEGYQKAVVVYLA